MLMRAVGGEEERSVWGEKMGIDFSLGEQDSF